MKLKLYHYWRSSSSWRVRWALMLKGIGCEFIPINLLTDEAENDSHLKRNPMGFVPVLEIDINGQLPGGTNLQMAGHQKDASQESSHFYLSESMAIIEWLEDQFPNPNLLPPRTIAGPNSSVVDFQNSLKRAQIRELAEIINAGTQPLQNLSTTLEHSADPLVQKHWNQKWTSKGLSAYQEKAQASSGRFTVGDEISLADLFLIPQMYNALRHELDMTNFPILNKIFKNALETHACKKSSPEEFKP